MTLEEYVKDHGYEVSDLTEEQLEEVKAEVVMVNEGIPFLDGFFSNYLKKKGGLD